LLLASRQLLLASRQLLLASRQLLKPLFNSCKHHHTVLWDSCKLRRHCER